MKKCVPRAQCRPISQTIAFQRHKKNILFFVFIDMVFRKLELYYRVKIIFSATSMLNNFKKLVICCQYSESA